MAYLQFLSKDSALYDDVKKISSIIIDYSKSHKKLVYGGLSVTLVTALALKYGPGLRHRFFAWLNSKAIEMKTEEYEEIRRKLFAPLADHKSCDPELQKENTIRILEIGVGVGPNLNYYPQGSRLIVVDPNPYFDSYFTANLANFPHIKKESVFVAAGEDMHMVKSGSIDVVVTTAVLCSVSDMSKVVSEIKRVLAPGGKYFFLEHVREWDRKQHRLRLLVQIFISLFIWPFICDGCHVNRDPLPVIESVGFSDVSADKFYAPIPIKLLTICSPHLKGVATK